MLDVKQLVLFAKTGMMDYFDINLAGMSLPIMLSVYEVLHFLHTESPERDAIMAIRSSEALVIAGGVCSVLFQIHTFGLCIWSAAHRFKHPLLACSKHAEAREIACNDSHVTCFVCDFCLRSLSNLSNLKPTSDFHGGR